jgi:hypothetical protein
VGDRRWRKREGVERERGVSDTERGGCATKRERER